LTDRLTDRSTDPAPYFAHHVFCCVNERPVADPRGCCAAKGSEKLRNYMKARATELGIKNIRINNAGCLDRCALGPTMVIYPEGVWYCYRTPEDVDEILRTHLIEGRRVERLMLHPEDTAPPGLAPPAKDRAAST
jgi:(2Fe-2S) ferredoxin